MPPRCELHSESPNLPATGCEVLPRAGFLLISSFFSRKSGREVERWYWNLLFNPWIAWLHNTSPCHDFFWLNGAVSIPSGDLQQPRTCRALAMAWAATAGEAAPWAVDLLLVDHPFACTELSVTGRAGVEPPLLLREPCSFCWDGRSSPSASAAGLATPLSSQQDCACVTNATAGEALPCPACRPGTPAAELRTGWALREQLDPFHWPFPGAICTQSCFQITFERDELSPAQPESGPTLQFFKQDSRFWCLSPSSTPFLCLLAPGSQFQGRRHLLFSHELCCWETSALGAPSPLPGTPTSSPSLLGWPAGDSQAPCSSKYSIRKLDRFYTAPLKRNVFTRK